jgi:hypothetical protein
MRFQRDPLSERFDKAARALITRAIANAQRKPPRPTTFIVESQPGEPREATELRLSVTERAFQRALYYDSRIHQLGRKKPDARWSLKQPAWEEVIGRRRFGTLRVYPDTAGARHVKRLPKERKFTENPALQSDYAVSRQDLE